MEKFILSLAALLFICFTNAQQLFTTTNIQNVYKKETGRQLENPVQLLAKQSKL